MTDHVIDPTPLLRQLVEDYFAAGSTIRRLLATGLPRATLLTRLHDTMSAIARTHGADPEVLSFMQEIEAMWKELARASQEGTDDDDDDDDDGYPGQPWTDRRPTVIELRRMLAESKDASPLPGQAPALECAIMFGSGTSIQGVLSETPEGGLRMLSPNADPQAQRLAHAQGTVAMTEMFFGYEDVVMFGVTRLVNTRAPRIVGS